MSYLVYVIVSFFKIYIHLLPNFWTLIYVFDLEFYYRNVFLFLLSISLMAGLVLWIRNHHRVRFLALSSSSFNSCRYVLTLWIQSSHLSNLSNYTILPTSIIVYNQTILVSNQPASTVIIHNQTVLAIYAFDFQWVKLNLLLECYHKYRSSFSLHEVHFYSF